MSDDQIIQFLMQLAGYVSKLHERSQVAGGKETNAGPLYDDVSIPTEEEGFARWMGWRGEQEQEREIKKKRASKGT